MEVPERPEWDDRDEETFNLLMPFLPVESTGGPYEDTAFVAGYQAGQIDGQLVNKHIAATTYLVFSRLIGQIDLIAMRHGYKFDILHDDGTWAQIGVTRLD